ncbi:pkb-activating kinase-like protein [Ceratobasidium sp. 394]|nr:pkb-activating kinase-like protein [Ceratobasidium sp. 394]
MAGLAGAGGQSGEGKVYAVKVSDKQYLINKGKVKYANVEKTALALLGTGNQHRGHPGIVKLYWTFHDPMSLYFVLDLVPNGELLGRIKRLGSLTADGARYYTAQIVDAVGWMHGMGVIHRDLKPENILLDEAFRVKITDFGSARVESSNPEVPSAPGTEGGSAAVPDQRTSSFVGTAEYVSPELLIHNVTSRCSDVWAIGCILFQMLAGRPPFKGGSEYLTLEQVKRLEYVIPDKFDETAGELVKSILVLDPASRPTIPDIRAHAFLADTVWDEVWTCDAPPMESGPVIGPPPPDSDDEEEDVGEAWDRLVGGDDDEEEEEGGPMSSALAPGEKPVFLSSILSRPRHRLTAVLPSKRRILVLTDTPRLLCMKEQRDRVVVKSELGFPVVGARPASVKSVSSTATPVSTNGRGRTLARWKSSPSAPGVGTVGSSLGAGAGDGEGPDVEPIALETVESVETKGEKSFVIQTLSKAYTYVAENPEEAARWVHQIKAMQHRKPRRPSVLSSRPA